MHVLYFSRDYTPHDYRFLSALAETDHEITSLRLERCGRQLEGRQLPSRIKQVDWRGGRKPVRWLDGWCLLADLRRVIRQVQPDLIHAGPIQKTAFLVALGGFKPLVSMSWGSDLLRDADLNWWTRWVTRYTLNHTAVLLGDCLAVRKKAEALGFPVEHVVLFPWGVDLQLFSPGSGEDFREQLGWQNAFVLLSVRSWEPLYGVDLLVKAFTRTAHQIPELRLMLLSGGSQAEQIRQTLVENGVVERVCFGDQVNNEDLPRYYRAADLYISASHSDGSSVSLMEALACGTPALVSDIPGNREWINHNEHGWLFADGDEDALAEGILQAVQWRQLFKKIGSSARALAEERADWRMNFRQLENAYKLALEMNASER